MRVLRAEAGAAPNFLVGAAEGGGERALVSGWKGRGARVEGSEGNMALVDVAFEVEGKVVVGTAGKSKLNAPGSELVGEGSSVSMRGASSAMALGLTAPSMAGLATRWERERPRAGVGREEREEVRLWEEDEGPAPNALEVEASEDMDDTGRGRLAEDVGSRWRGPARGQRRVSRRYVKRGRKDKSAAPNFGV